jgi:Serine endopeptidase inhibitors
MNQNEIQQPFFVQFLESQKSEQVQNTITIPAKDNLQTHKYPSDSDEEWDVI